MLVMSEHLGKCFRLIFKEIPIQWQLPVFIVIVVIIVIVVLFVMGLEISGPLFQIGRHGQVLRHQLEEKTNRIKELERQLDNVRRQEVLPRQNSIVPQTVIGKAFYLLFFFLLFFLLTIVISKLLLFCSKKVICSINRCFVNEKKINVKYCTSNPQISRQLSYLSIHSLITFLKFFRCISPN